MDENKDFDIMSDLAVRLSTPIDLVEAVAKDDFAIGIEDFDLASEEGVIMTALDNMIPRDAPYIADEEDFV